MLNAVDFECFIEDEEEEKIKMRWLILFEKDCSTILESWKKFYRCKKISHPIKGTVCILTIFAVSSRQKTIKNDVSVIFL